MLTVPHALLLRVDYMSSTLLGAQVQLVSLNDIHVMNPVYLIQLIISVKGLVKPTLTFIEPLLHTLSP